MCKPVIPWKPVSRWIKLYHLQNGKVKFRHKGRTYYLHNFVRCRNNSWGSDMSDVPEHIHGYDATGYYNPLFIEIENGGEMVRLWERM